MKAVQYIHDSGVVHRGMCVYVCIVMCSSIRDRYSHERTGRLNVASNEIFVGLGGVCHVYPR